METVSIFRINLRPFICAEEEWIYGASEELGDNVILYMMSAVESEKF